MRHPTTPCRRAAVACATALVAAAAVAPVPARAAAEDPFEAANRHVHAFNQVVRARVLGPLAELYLSSVPAGVRRGVGNALANLSEPITAVSGLAAGELELAANAAARFGINTTLGLAGVRDRAAEMGYPRQAFGPADAACRWGVPRGPFLVLPLLGPSTLRDAGAVMATTAALSQALGTEAVLTWRTGEGFVGYAELHHELERTDALSLDPYAVLRSAYLQRRAAACPADRVGELAGDDAAEADPEAP